MTFHFLALLMAMLATFIAPVQATPETKCIHVFVALCDNKSQGIVPVPEKLGDGDDPANNLYWGALYGLKTNFRKSDDWTLLSSEKKPAEHVLERCIFRHKQSGAFLVADAYQGSRIKQAVTAFLDAAAGKTSETLEVNGRVIAIHGGAQLVAYIGHNGLMDFTLPETPVKSGRTQRDAIVLACMSKQYFAERFSKLKARATLLTTGFMAPEAYTLKAALDGWLTGESRAKIKARAAAAYAKYQKCSLKAATNLFYVDDDK
jgi:hypothetical protein